MIYVGVDIAKLNHFVSAISSDGEIIIEPFKFTNDNDGFQLLFSKLDPLDKDISIIDPQSTAHYGDNLVRYLVVCNYKVCVEPHQEFYYAKKQHSQNEGCQSQHLHYL